MLTWQRVSYHCPPPDTTYSSHLPTLLRWSQARWLIWPRRKGNSRVPIQPDLCDAEAHWWGVQGVQSGVLPTCPYPWAGAHLTGGGNPPTYGTTPHHRFLTDTANPILTLSPAVCIFADTVHSHMLTGLYTIHGSAHSYYTLYTYKSCHYKNLQSMFNNCLDCKWFPE